MNKTQLYLQLPETNTEALRFSDTYLALSSFGTVLGLEFSTDVSSQIQVGDQLFIDKDNKTINAWADGPANVIGITFSSIHPAPASLVFTDRPLQLPIVFSSGEAGTIYEGSSIQSNWTEVDLSDNVPFPITFNIADVREINNRNGAYSKTISIPGTKTNNDVFKYIFDIQGVDNYDTRVKVKCNIVVDTIPVLEGYIQLNSIVATDNKHWTYECTIFGENANFSKEIDQNARLEDLDFSDFNHDFNLNTVTQSWVENWNYGYYYPYIDYNVGNNPAFRRLNSIKYIKGSIYAKQYWDRIFKQYGYTYESEFLNSPVFTDLIIPPTKSVFENDKDWRETSTFRAGLTQTTTYSIAFGWQRATNPTLSGPTDPYVGAPFLITGAPLDLSTTLQLNDTTPPNGDPGGNFTQVPLGDFYYKNVFQNNYDKVQDLVLRLDFDIQPQFTFGTTFSLVDLEGSRLLLYCDIFVNNQLRARRTIAQYGKVSNDTSIPNSDITYNLLLNSLYGEPEADWSTESFDRTQREISLRFGPDIFITLPDGSTVIENDLEPNDEVRFKLGAYHVRSTNTENTTSILTQAQNWARTGFNLEFYSTTDNVNGTYFFNNINPQLIDNQPYKAIELVPRNIKQIDFINSIVNMFNLYLYQDKVNPKKIFIEPRDRFYDTTQFLNWSDKLDISKEIEHTPIVERYKRIFMSYKSDKDFYNTLYNSQTKEIYGQFEYLTGDEFSTSEKKVEVIFSPTTLNMYQINDGTLDPTHIYSKIYDPKQPITTETSGKVESNIRILYRKTLTNNTNNFWIKTNSGIFSFNVFPYAGHLDDPTNSSLDLSFDKPRFLFYDNEFGYTDNNLYKEYYEQFFEEIYGPESKIITAYVYLNSQDILDFDYRKLIYIDNISSGSPGYFRVNKIEYDPSNKQSYKVELIKVLNNFKSSYKKIISIGDIGIALPGSGNSLVTPGNNTNTGNNNIVGGINSSLVGNNNLIAGELNTVKNGDNNIISGLCNSSQGKNNSLLGGRLNNISSYDSSIIAGASNSVSGVKNIIIGGYDNKLETYSQNSLIMSGYGNRIGVTSSSPTQSSAVFNSFILGGKNNTILTGTTASNTDNSFIIGGYGNTIEAGLTNSIILNGQNFTATQSNTIYLEGNVLINGSAPATVTPITLNEIAIGTGTGITSTSLFRTTGNTGRSLFIANQSETGSPLASVMMSSIGANLNGNNNLIFSSNNATVSSAFNGMFNSNNSQIIGTNTLQHINSVMIGSVGSSIINSVGSSIISSIGATQGGVNSSIIASSGSEIENTGFAAGDNAIIASAGSVIVDPALRSAIIASEFSKIDNSFPGAVKSAIIAGSGLTLAENNTLMTSNLRVDGVIRLANSSGIANITGTGTVATTLVTATSRILLTPREATNNVYYVENIVPGVSFDISEISGLAPATDISWLIINQ